MYTPEIDIPALFTDIDDVLRISRNNISGLSEIPSGSISKASAGQRNFTHAEFVRIRAAVDDLLEIQRRFAPAKLDWTDIRTTKKLVDDLHRQRAHPPQPLSPQESERLAKFVAGVDLDDLAIDAGMSKSEFLEYIGSLLARSTRIAEMARQAV
jgi:hypothetical protein